ncbi:MULTISPECIES: DUF305 domain-containing protein [Gammaproteobacteria]|nr:MULTISPECIES: DUF305 domain-containing protein [Gammaproteobacteria]SEE00884.1 protein of unknown function [Pseudomonas proteolytica]HEC5277302.1 DUF305 domain-containing protein [Enterobacter cloacae]
MSQHIKHNSSSRFTLLMRAVAMVVAVMAAAPTLANAAEPAKSETMPMPSEQMDQSKITKQLGGMSMTGDVDYDFAANMRMHHQMAVEMSQTELKNGKNPEMLRMAKDIIAAQNKEIAVLDQWIKANKKP